MGVMAAIQMALFLVQVYGLGVFSRITPPTEMPSTGQESLDKDSQFRDFERRVMDAISNVSKSSATSRGRDCPSTQNDEPIGAIMARTGTDKLTRHAYDRYYDIYFRDFRNKKGLAFLEIGADQGKSMQLWSEYFSDPSAIDGVSYMVNADQKKITCDWNPSVCDKITIFNGDQSNSDFLKSIYENHKYDIILDDGSHIPSHQLISLKYLFQALNPGGLYVIEDVESSYWNMPGSSCYGYPVPNAGVGASPQFSAVEKLKQIVDVLSRFHMAHPSLHIWPDDDKFFSITFGQGVVIIRRSTEAQLKHLPDIPGAQTVINLIDEWASKAAATNP